MTPKAIDYDEEWVCGRRVIMGDFGVSRIVHLALPVPNVISSHKPGIRCSLTMGSLCVHKNHIFIMRGMRCSHGIMNHGGMQVPQGRDVIFPN